MSDTVASDLFLTFTLSSRWNFSPAPATGQHPCQPARIDVVRWPRKLLHSALQSSSLQLGPSSGTSNSTSCWSSEPGGVASSPVWSSPARSERLPPQTCARVERGSHSWLLHAAWQPNRSRYSARCGCKGRPQALVRQPSTFAIVLTSSVLQLFHFLKDDCKTKLHRLHPST